MKPETALYRRIKTGLSKYVIKLVRIENTAGIAIPDVYFYTPESEGWIEFKFIKGLPTRHATLIKIPFRPGQVAWLHERYAMNRESLGFVLVGIGSGLFMFKNEDIAEAYTVDELSTRSCAEGPLSFPGTTLAVYKALLNR